MYMRRVMHLSAYPAGAMLLSVPVHMMYGGAWWAVSTVVALGAGIAVHVAYVVREARVARRNRIAAQQYARAVGYGVHP